MRRSSAVLAFVLATSAACGSSVGELAPPHQVVDPLSGGATTVYDATKGAYANMAPTVHGSRADAFNLGHAIFDRNWVTAPATTDDIDGLGPLYNQRSCSACHSKDGRAPPFDTRGAMLGMLVRISVPGMDAHGGPLGDPTYGTQIRPSAVLNVAAEAVAHETYEEATGTYGDGTAYSLQRPRTTIDGYAYGDPAPGLLMSTRVAPITIGLGLLEAVPEDALLANVRSGDPDGVVGKANRVWDVAHGTVALGRFGWKANVPSVLQQTAGAFQGDMGITSPLFPSETCAPGMAACNAAPSGGAPEIDGTRLDAVVFYMRTLAVPARRDITNPSVLHGEDLFESFGCASCHAKTFRTGAFPELPEVENQTIHPYSDLLLHDMGPDLADGRPDYEARGSEWRTPPLWGLGLLHVVNGHELLLHDARARGMAEAILWHGGEGLAARERFRAASAADRDALVAFLHSL